MLEQLQTILATHTIFANFETLEVKVLKDSKKEGYWGTSTKLYLSEIDSQGGERKFRVAGTIYLNLRDPLDIDKVLRIVAHESWHLLDEKEGTEEMIYEYLVEHFKKDSC